MHVVRHDSFAEDVLAAWAYLATRSPRSAEKLLRRIEETVALITMFPEGAREREDVNPAVRQARVKSMRYLVIYRTVDGRLDLLRLVHGARDLPAVLRED